MQYNSCKHRAIRTFGEYLKCVIDAERFVFNKRKRFVEIEHRIIPFVSASFTSSHFAHPSRTFPSFLSMSDLLRLLHTPHANSSVYRCKTRPKQCTELSGDYVTNLNPSDIHTISTSCPIKCRIKTSKF